MYRAVLGLATALMMGLSWPLWVEPSAIPRVPFVAGMPAPAPLLSWVAFGAILAALAGAAAGVRPRLLMVLATGLLTALILGDQHRFQAWIYQYLLLSVALAAGSAGRALALARVFTIALYFHSGLSKLDLSFAQDLGPQFLRTATHLLGLGGPPGDERARLILALAMPAAEILVALLLMARPTRRWGLAGAVALHGSLLALLGPFGMRHSTIVLVWNAAMLVEALVLFGPRPGPWPWARQDGDTFAWPAAAGAVGLAAVLPFGERSGLVDSWPSFALYASHVERTEVLVTEDDAERLGPTLRPHLLAGPPGWLRLDLAGWSRAARGVPVYPQNRANLGIVLGLAAPPDGPRRPRVIAWGRASAFSGNRDRVELDGPGAIARYAIRFRLNARPRDQPRIARRAEPAAEE